MNNMFHNQIIWQIIISLCNFLILIFDVLQFLVFSIVRIKPWLSFACCIPTCIYLESSIAAVNFEKFQKGLSLERLFWLVVCAVWTFEEVPVCC